MSVVHPLRLRYSAAHLVVRARPLLVDAGSRGDAPRIAAGCARAGVRIGDLALILHTHVHPDDCGNTADFDADVGMRLDASGVANAVLHTPGHTPGSISVVLDTGDAIVGDVIMEGHDDPVVRGAWRTAGSRNGGRMARASPGRALIPRPDTLHHSPAPIPCRTSNRP